MAFNDLAWPAVLPHPVPSSRAAKFALPGCWPNHAAPLLAHVSTFTFQPSRFDLCRTASASSMCWPRATKSGRRSGRRGKARMPAAAAAAAVRSRSSFRHLARWWTTASAPAADVPRSWPSLERRRRPLLPAEPPHAVMHAPALPRWQPPSRRYELRAPSACSALRAESMRWTLAAAGAAVAGRQGLAGWSLRPVGQMKGWITTKVGGAGWGWDLGLGD